MLISELPLSLLMKKKKYVYRLKIGRRSFLLSGFAKIQRRIFKIFKYMYWICQKTIS